MADAPPCVSVGGGTPPFDHDELNGTLDALPRSREVIAYCRGPYCVYADDAVRLLRSRGFKARRLDTGYPEWERTGHPTAAEPQEHTA